MIIWCIAKDCAKGRLSQASTQSQKSHSGALDTRRCSRKHPPSPKKMHSGALDTFGAECQITYAQCVFFISTHKCGRVAVKESVQHVMTIWCIAKDCAKGWLQITYAQCVFFISTHECGHVAVGGSVRHAMIIACIAKDCAEVALIPSKKNTQQPEVDWKGLTTQWKGTLRTADFTRMRIGHRPLMSRGGYQHGRC